MLCRIYQGTGPTDAYLVRDWLERNGIRAVVKGESLMSIRGQVPIWQGWPSIWVVEAERERAEVALREFHGPVLVHPDWMCRCGETNAATFGSCWSCGRDAA